MTARQLFLAVTLTGAVFMATGLPEARAEDGHEGGGAAALGWAPVGAGVLGTGSLVAYKVSRKTLIATIGSGGATRSLTVVYKPVLNFHMAMNLIAYSAGMAHGAILSGGADGISIALALVMTIMVASGVLMRFASSKIKLFNTQLHGQIFLVMMLIVLVLLHIATVGD